MRAELIGHVNASTGRWCIYRMPGKPGDLHEWYYGIEIEGREPPYCTHNSMRSVLYQFCRPRFVPLPQK